MGRKPKYLTEEDRLEARRAYNRKAFHKKNNISNDEGYIHPEKRHKINRKDGIVVVVETLNRLYIDVISLCCSITLLWTNDNDSLYEVKEDVLTVIKQWLGEQEIWDRRNKIFVFEVPEKHGSYVGKFTSISFQLYLKRTTTPTDWKSTLATVLPLAEVLIETIKNTCQRVGVTIAYKKGGVGALLDDESPGAAEPDTSGSCTL